MRTRRRRPDPRRPDPLVSLGLGVAAVVFAVSTRTARPDPWHRVHTWAPLVVMLLGAGGSWAVVHNQAEVSRADSYTIVRLAEQVDDLQQEVERIRVSLERQTQDRYTATHAARDQDEARRARRALRVDLDELARRVEVMESRR